MKLSEFLPDDVGMKRTVVGLYVIDVDVQHDEGVPNPCEEFDGFGMIRSLSGKHVNSIDPEEARDLLEDDPDVVPLSYFEHGLSLWGVQGTLGGTPDFQWDGVSFAGIWIPDDTLREAADEVGDLPGSPERKERMRRDAASACKTYTEWCNGSIYYYSVTARKAGKDVDTDSLGGLYGYEYAQQEVLGSVATVLDRLGLVYEDDRPEEREDTLAEIVSGPDSPLITVGELGQLVLAGQNAYQKHLARESQEEDGIHPDGCWFCGRQHPSQGCYNRDEDVDGM